MYFCFVDESGGFEAPDANPTATPLMAIVGLIVDSARLRSVTSELITAKMGFFPQKSPSGRFLDHILAEVKGHELRTSLRSTARNDRRHAKGYLDRVMQILIRHNIRLVGRIWVKGVGQPLDPAGSYTYAIQDITKHFHAFLAANHRAGMVIAGCTIRTFKCPTRSSPRNTGSEATSSHASRKPRSLAEASTTLGCNWLTRSHQR
jgi:hypothetical protein